MLAMPSTAEVAQIFPAMCERFLPAKADGVNAIIQFELSGDNGGLYWLRIAEGKCETGQGQAENPKMTLKAAADDYHAVVMGVVNPMQAFMSGKIKVQGDMSLAMKMQTMFAMT
jgi:putative sterol carrier protein